MQHPKHVFNVRKPTQLNHDIDALGMPPFVPVPYPWFDLITFRNGRTDWLGVLMLADLVNWHKTRFNPEAFEHGHKIPERKYQGEEFQRWMWGWENVFHCTPKQAKTAIERLKARGLIVQDLRNETVNGKPLLNVPYPKPVPAAIRALNVGITCVLEITPSTAYAGNQLSARDRAEIAALEADMADAAQARQAQPQKPSIKEAMKTPEGREKLRDQHSELWRSKLNDTPWVAWGSESRAVTQYDPGIAHDKDLILYACYTLNMLKRVPVDLSEKGAALYWMQGATSLCTAVGYDKDMLDRVFAYIDDQPQLIISSPKSLVKIAAGLMRKTSTAPQDNRPSGRGRQILVTSHGIQTTTQEK